MSDPRIDLLMAVDRARTAEVTAWVYVWFDLENDSVVFTVGPFPTEEAAMLSAEETLRTWHRDRDSDADYRYVVTPLWPE